MNSDNEDRPSFSGYYSYDYESSRVFATLKKVDERIKTNWGTEQYLNALDTLISHMVEPILRSCDYLDYMVAPIMAWHADAANHKITAHEREDAVTYMMAFLTRTDPQEKLLVLKRLRFDRNITLLLVDQWLSATEGYRDLAEQSLGSDRPDEYLRALHEIERNVSHTAGHSSLYAAVAAVHYWRRQVLSLRQQIVEKYYRLILNEAKSFYEQMQHSIRLDDTIQAMYLEASRALDKCNQEKGTITSYLQRWLRFSRSKMQTEKDTAFSVKGAARNGDYSYKALSLDDVQDSDVASCDSNEAEDRIDHVRKLARILDPVGVGRHALGVDEWLPALRKPL